MSYIGNTPGVSSQRTVLEEVITGSPKSTFVPQSGYVKGYVDVLVNGHELDATDYTAEDGITVNLAVAAAVGDTVKVKAWIPRGLSDGYTKSEADALFFLKSGGSLTGGLTAAGNLLMTANDGNARVVGVSNGTNTTLVLQGGGNGAGALGGNIELGRDGNNMYDAAVSRFRSLDGSTQYGQFDATGFSFANYLTGGAVPLARLTASGTTALGGTASGSTFLRGDGSWADPVTTLFANNVSATTNANRTIGYSTAYTDHLSVNITLSKPGPVCVSALFANFYEAGAVDGKAYIFISSGNSSYEYDVGQQGTANMGMGPHSLMHIFGNIPAGTYTVYLRVRNLGSGSNWILNNYIGSDGLYVMY